MIKIWKPNESNNLSKLKGNWIQLNILFKFWNSRWDFWKRILIGWFPAERNWDVAYSLSALTNPERADLTYLLVHLDTEVKKPTWVGLNRDFFSALTAQASITQVFNRVIFWTDFTKKLSNWHNKFDVFWKFLVKIKNYVIGWRKIWANRLSVGRKRNF